MDEFINASWGYVNGAPCNKIVKTDVLDWWVFNTDFFLLSKQVSANGLNVLQQYQNNQLVSAGVYALNSNKSNERYLTAMAFKQIDGPLVQSFYSGKLNTPTTANSLLWTNDNTTIFDFKAAKANINGTVHDAKTGKPLSGAAIQIQGDNLDKKAQASKTDSKGNFLFLSVSPYDTYTVNLSRTGYESQTDTTQVSTESTPLKYELTPTGQKTASFGKTWGITMPGGVNGTIQTSG
jgi:hypothetical protein